MASERLVTLPIILTVGLAWFGLAAFEIFTSLVLA